MLFLQNHRHDKQSHTIINTELEAMFYLTFSLTYRRFLNYKLQQFLEKFQFFLERFRMVSLLFMHCYFFYEIIDTASSHSSRQIMNVLPKQVYVYRDFILTRRRFLNCNLQQVIFRIWRNCHSFQRVNATIKTERTFGTE